MRISKSTQLILLTMLVSGFLLTFAYAQDPAIEQETKIELIVADEVGDKATRIDWTSNDPNIDFMSMQVGESQSIVDESGRNILVTKEEGGLRFNVDGESIIVPDMGEMHGEHMAIAMVAADGSTTLERDIDVNVIHGNATATAPGAMIITDKPLDAATQDSIRSLLQSAGENDVKFVASDSENRQIKVIRKQVEVTH